MSQICPNCSAATPAGSKFCGNCGTKLEVGEGAAPLSRVQAASPVASALASHDDERRDVTILFADIKGFTAMCECMDPEQVHEIMNECFRGLGSIIQEEGGHIDKYIGDNIMALFGAPIAHEDDPARACRSALRMQQFIGDFAKKIHCQTQTNLQMRIGIHCGLVIAGGVGADETRKDYSVMGDAVNTASRLESAAEPGSILVSSDIASRARGRFAFGEAKSLLVKGKEEPLIVHQLVREISEIDTRGHDGFSVELIGRKNEIKQLLSAWKEPQDTVSWIEICGELGLGKTRLVEEWIRQAEPSCAVMASASAVIQRRPYGLARRLVQEIIRTCFVEHFIPVDKKSFVEKLALISPEVALYGDTLWFLATPGPTSVPAPDPDPQTLKSIVEKSIQILLEAVAKNKNGLTIVLDSFELSDAESIAVFRSIQPSATTARLNFIVTVRPEGPTLDYMQQSIRLQPLNDDDALKLFERLLRGTVVPESVLKDAIRLSAGNPLFLEELARSIVNESEKGTIALALPPSIRLAMVARMDRLPASGRDLLRRGSIQGVEFYFDIVERLNQLLPANTVLSVETLKELISNRTLVENSVTKRLRVEFTQPALQEAAYDTLLVRQRRELHKETAKIISQLAGGDKEAAPELLAFHYERAEEWGLAARANLEEGRRASELFLNQKAEVHLKRAEEALQKLPSLDASDISVWVQVLRELAEIHLRVGRYHTTETYALTMLSKAERDTERAEALRLQAGAKKHLGDLRDAQKLLEEALVLATAARESEEFFHIAHDLASLLYRDNKNEEALAVLANVPLDVHSSTAEHRLQLKILRGSIYHSLGKFEEARQIFEAAYALAQKEKSISVLARVLNCLGNLQRDLGNYDQSRVLFEQALALWERTGNTHYIAGMHNNLGNLAMSVADYDLAKEHQTAAYEAYQAIGNAFGAALACANLAMLANEHGSFQESIERAKHALEILGEGGNWLVGLILGVLGEAYVGAAELELARQTFKQVTELYNEASHPLACAGAVRGLGRVHLAEENYADAAMLLLQAISQFENLQRKHEVGRSRVYRASALEGLGELEEAKQELEAALKVFEAISAKLDIESTKERLFNLRS